MSEVITKSNVVLQHVNSDVRKWLNLNVMTSQDFYQIAINQGDLSTNSGTHNYAGKFMFMGLSDQYMAFKSIDTREYVRITIRYNHYMRIAINKD